ncbi:hypothetical protein RCC89_05565 [Cytophagaceae bacterium ABcell3]|nr:hypothetical protein RCC89_05565 [Cytophagaceae bacterium ABcell3]
MKKIFLSIAILGSTVAFAQSPQKYHKQKRANCAEKKEAFRQELNLSDEQELAMNTIQKKYKERFSEVKNNEELSPQERREAFMSLSKEQKSEVNEILTAEQVQKVNEKRESFAKEHKGKKKKYRKADFKQLQKDLDLTDEQVNDWKDLKEKSRRNIKEVKGNEALSEEEKRAEIKNIRSEKKAELKNILSEEQYEKYKENRSKKHHGHKRSRR